MHEAKTHLSKLLDEVAAGEEVVMTRRGKEVAALVSKASRPRRKLGVDRGRFVVPDDFDAPLPEDLLAEFER